MTKRRTEENGEMSGPPSPFSAGAIEVICKILGDVVTGGQIPNLLSPLHVTESAGQLQGTKWKRLFNAVVAAQNHQGDGRPLLRLIGEVMAPVRFPSPQDFEACRTTVNTRLLLDGFEVLSDGRVGRAVKAQTLTEAQNRANRLQAALTERKVHPRVLGFCRAELLQNNYFHAVLEACKSIAERIRELTGLAQDGSKLIDAATGTASGLPLLAFNGLSTEWDRMEHAGLAMLAKGLFSATRNPTAHAPKVRWAVDEQEALDVLTIASMLHRRLDDSVVHPRP